MCSIKLGKEELDESESKGENTSSNESYKSGIGGYLLFYTCLVNHLLRIKILKGLSVKRKKIRNSYKMFSWQKMLKQ